MYLNKFTAFRCRSAFSMYDKHQAGKRLTIFKGLPFFAGQGKAFTETLRKSTKMENNYVLQFCE